MAGMHLLSRVVTESEEGVVEQVPEEGQPSLEVGFDICGSSKEPNTSTNQGKPRSIQNDEDPFCQYRYSWHFTGWRQHA
jgi:hypothetical protein